MIVEYGVRNHLRGEKEGLQITKKLEKFIRCEKCKSEVVLPEENTERFILSQTCYFCDKFLCNTCKSYHINFPFQYQFCDECESDAREFLKAKDQTLNENKQGTLKNS